MLASGGLVVPTPNEFSLAAPDRDKLTAAADAARDFVATVGTSAEPVRTPELWPLCAALGLLSFILMILVRRLPAAGLALFLTLAALGLSPRAMSQEMDEKPTLTPMQKERIDGFLEMEPAESRQKLKDHCRELTQHYGNLQPLCDYLESKEKDDQLSSIAGQLLVVAAIADGNLDLARQTLDALIGLPSVDRRRPDFWALSEMARVQEMLGESDLALTALKLAVLSLGTEKTEDPGMRFAVLVRKAQLLYDANNKDAAREALRGILAEPDFNRPEGRNYCARIAGLHGDYELVEELFTPIGEGRALMFEQLYFGQILMHLDRPGAAREQFTAALELSSLQRDRRYILDRIVSSARAADELSDLVDQWLSVDPHSARAESGTQIMPEQLEILVGVLGGELDRAQDVLPLLEREDFPAKTQGLIQSPVFQQRIIMMMLETGNSALAREKYRELIARHPKQYCYHNALDRLLLMEGERAEAEAFFRETIAATETVGGLMGLATSARSMALEEVAMEAASKAGGMGQVAHVAAVLFEAELHRQHGEADKTLEVLQTLEQEIGDDAELMIPLSEAYERYDYKADAIRLTQKAYDLTKSEKLLERLIALMEVDDSTSSGRHDQLFVLYRQLWETASEPMAVLQAQDRLLDLGSKNGKLVDIVIELEERLDHGKLSDRELAMLLEIYTSVNDPVSAADILLEVSQQRGSACKSLGIDHFAYSLSRWSVARDVQTKGTSRWLSDYLDNLPENTRRPGLRALLPHMGINAVRLDASGNEAALFTALLDLGMEAEATDLLDRYLRRLRLIDARSAAGYKFRSFYLERMGGVVDPVSGALHDAMAVAPARLNRPDDYRHVLIRRAILELTTPPQHDSSLSFLSRPTGSVIYSIGGSGTRLTLEDHSHALPLPDQVDDINRYLDIHLEVHAWLQDLGKLSREHHVAQICMLGQWCAEQGLDGQAAERIRASSPAPTRVAQQVSRTVIAFLLGGYGTSESLLSADIRAETGHPKVADRCSRW